MSGPPNSGNIRLGLCCQFRDVPIRFRNTTVKHALGLATSRRLDKLATLCCENAHALSKAIEYCAAHGIGDFRINSQILPLKTHPEAGYEIGDLPRGDDILADFKRCGQLARMRDVRLTMHPDQFILLSSEKPDVTARSIAELEYHGEFCELVGGDVINLHGGGAYGDKRAALERVASNLDRLSDRVRQRLTLENDDRTYTPADLLPLCRREGIPLVYDVHHHRCLEDRMTVREATEAAAATWNREPVFHISSPIDGWNGPRPQRHHDFIDDRDFPGCWRTMKLTVEVEAKAKEAAVLALKKALERMPPFNSQLR